MTSLRKAIDEKCKDCTYDPLAPGTWRQQTSLCTVDLCALYELRPKSTRPIPESVLSYRGAESGPSQAIEQESVAFSNATTSG